MAAEPGEMGGNTHKVGKVLLGLKMVNPNTGYQQASRRARGGSGLEGRPPTFDPRLLALGLWVGVGILAPRHVW